MASAQRVALSFFLFASSMMMISFSDAADQVRYEDELYTNVPYYMIPPKTNESNWGGFAPYRKNQLCPIAIVLTPEGDIGVPIVFTIPNGKTVRMNQIPAVYPFYISFVSTNTSVIVCHNIQTTWGRLSSDLFPHPSSHFLRLVPSLNLDEPATFWVWYLGPGRGSQLLYTFYDYRLGGISSNFFSPRYDSENGITRLGVEIPGPSYFPTMFFRKAYI